MKHFTTLFYMFLSIAGISFIFLMGIIAFQYFSGNVGVADLQDMMKILGGQNRVVLPSPEFERFQAFKKDEAAARRELEENRGLPGTRVPAVLKAEESEAALRENLAVANKLLTEEKNRVLTVRAEVETQKKQLETLKKALDDERQKNALVEKDATTAKLRKTLSEMDAGEIGAFLTNIVRDPSLGGPVEAARIIRDHLKADFSAEVLGEIREDVKQKIIPLLENKYAGVPPDAVVKLFQNQNMSPGEQAVYLLQMNPQQALGVYLRLPSADQEELAQKLLKMP